MHSQKHLVHKVRQSKRSYTNRLAHSHNALKNNLNIEPKYLGVYVCYSLLRHIPGEERRRLKDPAHCIEIYPAQSRPKRMKQGNHIKSFTSCT